MPPFRLYLVNLNFGLSCFAGSNKSIFHPPMTDTSRIRCCPCVCDCTRPVCTVTALQILVLCRCEMRKLVKADKVVCNTLVFILVLFGMQASKVNLCTRGESPSVFCLVVLCIGKSLRVVKIGFKPLYNSCFSPSYSLNIYRYRIMV